VSFREDDVWESDEEKETFREGAAQVAQALFEVAGEEYNSPREVYRAVFGGAVEVRRVNDSCAGHFNQPTWTCFASWDDGINVYTNADGYIEGYVMWAMHELFHGFNANAGGQPYLDLEANPIIVDGTTISPDNGHPRTHDGYQWGEGGEGDETPFVNSWDNLSVGEDFADMGANWAANSFTAGDFGTARYNWMDRRMQGWIALAVAHNR
jgi:hypothetical protein